MCSGVLAGFSCAKAMAEATMVGKTVIIFNKRSISALPVIECERVDVIRIQAGPFDRDPVQAGV